MHVYVHGEAKGLLGSVSLLTLHSVDKYRSLRPEAHEFS